jgi:hypothetical protein
VSISVVVTNFPKLTSLLKFRTVPIPDFWNVFTITLIQKYISEKKCKIVKVTLTKNTTLQRIEQLSLIKCNCIRN